MEAIEGTGKRCELQRCDGGSLQLKGDMYIVDRLFDRAQLVIGVGKKSRTVEIKRESPS